MLKRFFQFRHKRGVRIIFLMLAVLAAALLTQACGGTASEDLVVGDTAPAFSLPAASGDSVALADYAGTKPALLYFHMALG